MMSGCCFVGLLLIMLLMLDFSVSKSMSKRDITIASPFSQEPKENCTQQLLDWCMLNQNSTHQMEEAIVLIDYYDMLAQSRVYCIMGSGGTECVKYEQPWFYCYPNGTLSYKDTILTDSNSAVDDDICETKETAKKLANQLGFKKVEYENGIKKYIEDVLDLRKQVRLLKDMISDMDNQLLDISPFIFDVNTAIGDRVSTNGSSKVASPQDSIEITPQQDSIQVTPEEN